MAFKCGGFLVTAGAILTVRKLFPRFHTIRMGLDFFFHKHNPSSVICGGGRAAIYPDPAAPIFIPPEKFQSSQRASGGGVPLLCFWGGIEGALFAEKLRAARAAGLKAA